MSKFVKIYLQIPKGDIFTTKNIINGFIISIRKQRQTNLKKEIICQLSYIKNNI